MPFFCFESIQIASIIAEWNSLFKWDTSFAYEIINLVIIVMRLGSTLFAKWVITAYHL